MAQRFYEMKIDSQTSLMVWDPKGKAVTIKLALHHKSDLNSLHLLFESVHLIKG
ncbi:uncharacterized protein LACBIDRAFT_307766 [Laccaria bicolor S238N-H82]|uniref:Predicted protein n=1 Tax=Laccaria bicolor (strain S238N-H82 / ATCC MYA-4686) TaxID=486041 RepID=B0DQZ6_LACBS|nr:uncharacterized protein LACBIDRAFT_307766 [Laccaria bicolor S238N-H82]EDR02910.1 predicted protein [Laccaria bicolor S238N-H82]|eukprot:XP_001886333.1 predicted protein [Laccaria bicolor S238N-H82]